MESLSIEQINKLQEENEAYKQSEQEASEIIAELKHKNKTLKKKLNCFKAALEEIRSYCIGCENGINAKKIKEYIDEVLK